MNTFDVAIVGARCAGAPLAKVLADRGYAVCLIDKARFPSETPSTCALQSNGVDALGRMGMLERLLQAGPPVMTRVTTSSTHSSFTIDVDPQEYGRTMGISRFALDDALVRSAAEAGADVRTGCAASELIVSDGRVVGVRTSTGDVCASVVVGADGRNSMVAKHVGAAEYCTRRAGRLPTWAVLEGVDPTAGFFFGGIGRPTRGSTGFLGLPLEEGRYLAAVTVPMDLAAEYLQDRYTGFARELELFPQMADAVRDADRVGPLRVLQKWHSYFRVSAGPGWVLVGDAGNFKDYSLGQGMSDAMRQAETLADAIDLGLRTGDVDERTRQWWRWRDADAWQMYWANCLLGEPYLPSSIGDLIFGEGEADAAAALKLAGIMNKSVTPLRAVPPQAFVRAVPAAAAEIGRHTLHDRPNAALEVRALTSMAAFSAQLLMNRPSHILGSRRFRATPGTLTSTAVQAD
ncbi:NAD(P)/FAD-dependent oxidoreductase [Tsukamurella sp. 1534]|uniref:NAD(P)/FAD-dependent oxidoreductase n=1 Tax=Tsukamurella sp. 1534 TaxID=1151061 RepID=UPI00030A72CF|nr:NAD(P)/FAD-dependent oxidoreductase [Tsukamurella sp. 1534]